MECAVNGCSNYYRKTIGKSIAYHSFPRNPVYRQKWIDFCNRIDGGVPKSSAKICSVHFAPSCYKRDLEHELLGLPSRKRKFLNDDAVPTRTSNTENPTVENPKIAKKLRELLPKPSSESTSQIFSFKKIKLVKEILKKPRTEYSTPEQPNVVNTPSPITETSIEQQIASQPNEVTGVKIKVEVDDGSYDVNKELDSSDKDVIPSTLCEVVLKSEESTEQQSLNKTVELGQTTKPKENVTFSSLPVPNRTADGPTVKPKQRVILGALRPSKSKTPVLATRTNESSNSQTTLMPVTNIGTITVPASNLMANNIHPAVSSPVIIAEHPIETFFRSMSKTVLTFPPHLIAEARMKVCSVVTELELRAIKENHSSKESAT